MPSHHNDDSQDEQDVAVKGEPVPGNSPPGLLPSSTRNQAEPHVDASSPIDPDKGEPVKEGATTRSARNRDVSQDRRRRGIGESLVLVLIAATVTLTAGLWAWDLASGELSPAPRLPSPGTIVVAMEPATAEAKAPIEVSLQYSASIGQQTTRLGLALTQTVASASTQTNPPSLLVFLCGPISQDPHFVDNRQASITWHRPNLEYGEIYSSSFGRASECIYTHVKLTSSVPGRIRQALLLGTSGAPPSQVSGDKVLYGLPGVVTMPAQLPIGDLNPAPLPTGSTMTVHLTEIPGDLQNVTASPQLPDSGRLRWTADFGSRLSPPGEFRLAGQLGDRQAQGQRQLFLAGALVGVAGGGLVWLIELLANMTASVARRIP